MTASETSAYGGPVKFLGMGALAIVSLVFYWPGQRLYEKRQ